MVWTVKIIKEAQDDFRKLDGSLKKQVAAGIIKVSKAPLPAPKRYGDYYFVAYAEDSIR